MDRGEVRVAWTKELLSAVHPRRGETSAPAPGRRPTARRSKRATTGDEELAARFVAEAGAAERVPRPLSNAAGSPRFFIALRRRLASASASEYASARDRAALARPLASMAGRVGIGFAFPDEPAFAEDAARECLASAPWLGAPLLASLRSAELCADLLAQAPGSVELRGYLLTMAHDLGATAMDLLIEALPTLRRNGAARAAVSALSVFRGRRTAEVFASLLEDRSVRPVVARWFESEPELARAVLPALAASRKRSAYVARAILAAVPVPESVPVPVSVSVSVPASASASASVPASASASVPASASASASASVPASASASASALPSVLVAPPWRAHPPPSPLPPLTLAPRDLPESIDWQPGELEEHTQIAERMVAPRRGRRGTASPDDAALVRISAGVDSGSAFPGDVLLVGDDERALSLWNATPAEGWAAAAERWQLLAILARFGVAALPGCAAMGVRFPEIVAALAAVASTRLAPIAAAALSRKRTRADARQWLARHAEIAATGLLPAALGPPDDARRDAALAIRWLAHCGHSRAVREAALRYGAQAADATEALLRFDPLLDVPARPPKLPQTWKVESLPPPRSRDAAPLPLSAVVHLVELLAISPFEPPSPFLADVRASLDAESLDDFVQALSGQWIAAGAPASGEWALAALAHLGGDTSARWIAARVPEWVEERSRARAQMGLEILAAIGSDVALLALGRLARGARSQGLKDLAASTLAELAARRKLTPEEMDDRTVPDLGLRGAGTRELDFGARKFQVSLDEHLRPVLTDAGGRMLRALPRQSKGDDPELAAAATRTYRALRQDAEHALALLLARMERAMCERRRWRREDFESFLLAHPVTGRVTRRLVWGSYTETGELQASFRATDESDLADSDDRPWTLPPGARLGIAHPLDLGEAELARWTGVLADYRVVQPFPQLARPTFTPMAEERVGDRLLRLEGGRIWGGRLFALRSRGWRAEGDGLTLSSFRRTLPAGRAGERRHEVRVSVHPGLDPGSRELVEHTVVSVVLSTDDQGARWGDTDPVAFSEVVLELAPR